MDLPDDRQSIEINGSFKKKTDVDGNVTVYEARLVAKSFSQVQGVDYDEIFSSVAMLKSVGIMLALAACMKTKCRLWQNGLMVVRLLSTDGF